MRTHRNIVPYLPISPRRNSVMSLCEVPCRYANVVQRQGRRVREVNSRVKDVIATALGAHCCETASLPHHIYGVLNGNGSMKVGAAPEVKAVVETAAC